MRRLALLGVGLATLVATADSSDAGHGPGRGPRYPFAIGAMHTSVVDFTGAVVSEIDVQLVARGDRRGEGARGRIFVSQTGVFGFELVADVTCLTVDGNLAVAGGPIEHVEGIGVPPGVFQTFFLAVRDADGPGGDPETPDTFQGNLSIDPPPATCPLFDAGIAADEGNVVVHDAAR